MPVTWNSQRREDAAKRVVAVPILIGAVTSRRYSDRLEHRNDERTDDPPAGARSKLATP